MHSHGPQWSLSVSPDKFSSRPASSPHALRGTALALISCVALVALWLVPALILGGPKYREAVLWTQTAGRTVSSFAHAHPFWFYLPLLPALLFPWGWIPAFWKPLRLDGPERFLWIATLGPFLIFSLISGKQLHYLVPELPMLALLLARRSPENLRNAWGPVAILLVMAVVFPALSLGLIGDEAAQLVSIPVAALIAVLLGVGAWAIATRPWLTLGAAPLAITLLHLGYAIGPAGQIMSPVRLAARIAPADGQIGMVSGFYHADFNFSGRLHPPIDLLTTKDEIETFAKAHRNGLIIARLDHEGALPEWLARETIAYRNEDWAIWSNKDKP